MAMSQEARAAASERMRAMHASGRMKKHAQPKPPQPAMPPAPEPVIRIAVDWRTVPLDRAQILFGILKKEMELASSIMNTRLNARHEFPCAGPGCGHMIRDGEEKFKDCSVNPPNRVCSERCYMNYTQLQMANRVSARQRTSGPSPR